MAVTSDATGKRGMANVVFRIDLRGPDLAFALPSGLALGAVVASAPTRIVLRTNDDAAARAWCR
jgi:hypothetical protein